MTKQTFAMDRVMASIIQQPKFATFTFSELRIAYQSTLAADSQKALSDIRQYVCTQIGRMHKIGWLTKNNMLMSRDLLYKRGEFPSNTILKLVEPTLFVKALPETEAELGNTGNRPSSPAVTDQILLELDIDIQVRMNSIAKVGKKETYKSQLSVHPTLKEKLTVSCLESRKKSSTLFLLIFSVDGTFRCQQKSHMLQIFI